MTKSPKYSVGCEVAYKGEDGSQTRGRVNKIVEVGREVYLYGLDCNGFKPKWLYEECKLTDKLNE